MGDITFPEITFPELDLSGLAASAPDYTGLIVAGAFGFVALGIAIWGIFFR